jgi:predicted metal-dependent hydrolase
MLIKKTAKEYQIIINEKDEQIKALYARIKDTEEINEAQKKLNGVLQRQLSEAKANIQKLENNRLDAGRRVLF